MGYDLIDIGHVVAVPGFRGSEAVAVDQEGRVYGGGNDGIVRRRLHDGRVEEFARCGDGQLAGMAFDADDNLFVCDPYNGLLLKVNRRGNVTTFADRVGDRRLHLPNFPVFDSEGNIWVSNSFDGPLAEIDWDVEFPEPHAAGFLARLRSDGSGVVVTSDLYFPNGLAIEPSEEHVYVLQSTKHNCVRVPLAGGSVEVYCPDLGSMPDGMAFDAEGSLIVTLLWERRLVVVDRAGHVTTLVSDPPGDVVALPTNCAFAGQDFDVLYVAQPGHTDHLARLHVGHKGHPLFNMR